MHLDCSKLCGSSIKKNIETSHPPLISAPCTSDRIRATITGCRDTEYRCLYLAAGEVPAPVSQSDAPTAVSFLPLQGCSPPALLQRQCLHGKSTTADSVLVILFFTNRRWLSLQFAQQLIVPLWVVWVDSDRTGYQTPPGPNIHLRAYRV